jgi:hypothetical protein
MTPVAVSPAFFKYLASASDAVIEISAYIQSLGLKIGFRGNGFGGKCDDIYILIQTLKLIQKS